VTERLDVFGLKVVESSLCPDDTVLIVRNMGVMSRVVLTANLLADQELEIERLKVEVDELRNRLMMKGTRGPSISDIINVPCKCGHSIHNHDHGEGACESCPCKAHEDRS
jgi:hypothetical protein